MATYTSTTDVRPFNSYIPRIFLWVLATLSYVFGALGTASVLLIFSLFWSGILTW